MPLAKAESPTPPVALATLLAPSAYAKSPTPEVAVALPLWVIVNPSIEMAMSPASNVGSVGAVGNNESAAALSGSTGKYRQWRH